MNIKMARALLLATAAIISCGTGGASTGTTGAPGPQGLTTLVVSWTFGGSPASGAACATAGAAEVSLKLSGAFNPAADQNVTFYCSAGAATFTGLLVQDLGTAAQIEGTLLDSTGAVVPMGILGVDIKPALGTTAVTLAFFPSQSTGGGGAGTSTSTSTSGSSSSTTSSSGGTGGAPSTSSSSSTTTTTTAASSSGGTGGSPSTSSSSSTTASSSGGTGGATSSSSSTTSSSSSTTSSSSGM